MRIKSRTMLTDRGGMINRTSALAGTTPAKRKGTKLAARTKRDFMLGDFKGEEGEE